MWSRQEKGSEHCSISKALRALKPPFAGKLDSKKCFVLLDNHSYRNVAVK